MSSRREATGKDNTAPFFLVHENETSAEPIALNKRQLCRKSVNLNVCYVVASTPNPPDSTVTPEE